jgi:hypothetical protein
MAVNTVVTQIMALNAVITQLMAVNAAIAPPFEAFCELHCLGMSKSIL